MKLTQEDIAELEAVFHIFTDGRSGGSIGRTELDLAMNYLGIDVDEAQLKRIFDKLDKDGGVGGRKINYRVFLGSGFREIETDLESQTKQFTRINST